MEYKVIRTKALALKNGLPVGEAYQIGKQKHVEIDPKALNDSLKLFSLPLIRTALKSILPN